MLAVARRRSGANNQMPSGSAITIANSSGHHEGELAHTEQVSDAEDRRGQDDDQQQSGRDVGEHIDNEPGSGSTL